MKTKQLLNWAVLCLFLSLGNLNAQVSTPFSPHAENQIVQGPCYIFAAVAAIEANAKKQGLGNIDLSEWFLFSDCVNQGGLGGVPMMKRVLDQLEDRGGLFEPYFYKPSFSTPGVGWNECDNCPNVVCNNADDFALPCEFYVSNPEFDDFCTNGCIYGLDYNPPGNGDPEFYTRIDDFDEIVRISSPAVVDIPLSEEANSEKAMIIKDLIEDNEIGVTLFVNDYAPSGAECVGQHSIFVHGFFGFAGENTIWRYKDSWPCRASANRAKTLNMDKVVRAVLVTADVNIEESCYYVEVPCAEIQGPGTLTSEGQYLIDIPTGNTVANIVWTVTDGLTITGLTNRKKVNVKVVPCGPSTATITVTYLLNGEPCEDSMEVTINGNNSGNLPTPGILVLSPNWNNGATCPNTILELNAILPGSTAGVTFEWSIQGAQILSGQGTSTLFVNTWNSTSSVPLVFKVRAVSDCDVSDWATVTGVSSPRNCRGGGGGEVRSNWTLQQPNGDSFILTNEGEIQQANYQLFDLSGRLILNGQVATNEIKNIANLGNGIYFLRIENQEEIQTLKLLKY